MVEGQHLVFQAMEVDKTNQRLCSKRRRWNNRDRYLQVIGRVGARKGVKEVKSWQSRTVPSLKLRVEEEMASSRAKCIRSRKRKPASVRWI